MGEELGELLNHISNNKKEKLVSELEKVLNIDLVIDMVRRTTKLINEINFIERKVIVTKLRVKYKDKKYSYPRKRIELPADFEGETAYVINKEDYDKLVKALNELKNALMEFEKK